MHDLVVTNIASAHCIMCVGERGRTPYISYAVSFYTMGCSAFVCHASVHM